MSNTIQFTQGNAATITLFAEDEFGTPLDLTGASISTSLCGKTSVATFDNSKHTVVDATKGQYTLNLDPADTAPLEIGPNQDVLSTVTQSGKPLTFRGIGELEVFGPPRAQSAEAKTNIFLGAGLGC